MHQPIIAVSLEGRRTPRGPSSRPALFFSLLLLLGACSDDTATGDPDAAADQGADTVADPGTDSGADGVADGAEDTVDAGPACRNYATSSTLASTNVINGSAVASFDSTSLELTSTLTGTLASGDSVSQVFTYTYASLDDFVEEPATMGRILYVTVTSSGDLSNAIETYTYDVDQRLTAFNLDDLGPDDRNQDRTYTEWDSLGRPTDGTMNVTGLDCADFSVTIEYDDVERKRTTTVDFPGGVGAQCASIDTRISWEVYDQDGNVIEQVINATADELEPITNTVEETEEICL